MNASLYSKVLAIAWIIVMTGCAGRISTTTSPEEPGGAKICLDGFVPTTSPTFPISPPDLSQTGESVHPSISPDGRYVVFASNAGGLTEKKLPQCTYSNDASTSCSGIFLYDRQAHEVEMVSVSSEGQPANGASIEPAVSADGHWIVFQSQATNLDGNPAEDDWGLFVHNRLSGVNQMISASGGRYPTISGDGRFVAYQAHNPLGGDWSIFLYDRHPDQTQIVSTPPQDGSPENDFSILPRLSSDGRWLAFWSWADTLTGDDDPSCSKDCGDIFLYDRNSAQLERIGVGDDMGEGMIFYPLSFSEDGRWLAFRDLIYDRQTRRVTPLCLEAGDCLGGILSGNGQWVAYAEGADVYVQDRLSGEHRLASIGSAGVPGNGEIVYCTGAGLWCATFPEFDLSRDGQWVMFSTTASNLVDHSLGIRDDQMCGNEDIPLHNCRDIYLHDFETGITTWISRPYSE